MRNKDHEDELSDILIDDNEEEKPKGRSRLFLVVAMAGILLLVVVFAIYALTRDDGSQQASATTPMPPAAALTPPPQQGIDQNIGSFSGVGINTTPQPTTPAQPAPAGKDKFEDIIARIKNEQNKPSDIPNKPQPAPQPTPMTTPPTTVVAPPTTATNSNDLQGLFKPQTNAPAPAPATPEPIVTAPAPAPAPKPAPKEQPSTPPKTVNVASDPNGNFAIQVASVSKFSEDSNLAKQLKNHKLPYTVQEENVNNKTVYRVLIGPYGSRADAQKVLTTVRYYLEKEAFIKQVK